MNAEQKAILTLHLVPDIGPRRFQRLIERFGTAAAALAAPLTDLRCVEDVPAAVAERVVRARAEIDVDGEIAAAAQAGARIVTCVDDAYPPALRTLSDGPTVLYVRGSLAALHAAGVALVGTRHPTAYGRTVAARFAAACSRANITTISGLARGIDTAAHEAALEAGGQTIAVLGNGLLHHYPPENKGLEGRIVEQGALVTEFAMNVFPDRTRFPLRNRIISGLSRAVVVVEAGIKSGALITARYAAEQGREVYAVPGPVSSPVSRGPHFLIKSGARLAEDAGDILQDIGPAEDLFASAAVSAQPAHPDPDARRILSAITATGAGASIDDIAAATGLAAGDLAKHLLDMEFKGLIRELPGKVFVLRAAPVCVPCI